MAGPGERRLVVDRFEGDLVVVGDDAGRFLDLPRWLLPSGLREGDVVAVHGEGEGAGERVVLRIDREASAAARAEAAELLVRLGRGT